MTNFMSTMLTNSTQERGKEMQPAMMPGQDTKTAALYWMKTQNSIVTNIKEQMNLFKDFCIMEESGEMGGSGPMWNFPSFR